MAVEQNQSEHDFSSQQHMRFESIGGARLDKSHIDTALQDPARGPLRELPDFRRWVLLGKGLSARSRRACWLPDASLQTQMRATQMCGMLVCFARLAFCTWLWPGCWQAPSLPCELSAALLPWNTRTQQMQMLLWSNLPTIYNEQKNLCENGI